MGRQEADKRVKFAIGKATEARQWNLFDESSSFSFHRLPFYFRTSFYLATEEAKGRLRMKSKFGVLYKY